VQIDGERMPLAPGGMPFKLNPGMHQLRVSAPGYLLELRSVTLAEQEHRVLPIALVAAPPAPPEQQLAVVAPAGATEEDDGGAARTRGYVALGVAGAAALAGAVTGALALSSKPDCPGNLCDARLRGEADRSRRYGNVATVSFGVALATAAYGGWELLFNAAPDSAASVKARAPRVSLVPREGGAALQLSGVF
jgi:hypothetical protein